MLYTESKLSIFTYTNLNSLFMYKVAVHDT